MSVGAGKEEEGAGVGGGRKRLTELTIGFIFVKHHFGNDYLHGNVNIIWLFLEA